ncbi:hypothetical protein BPAE_0007g00880 [Botrytis paeoniae]|uniref:Uncharacterized protein n=1 Tax=Botrytis paeoniae TaxID=278948 RepID=A0A4Z1G8C9_9HELO|nr:hypothetical protein BPAE_0007g00880 [Botrytis paeoniae]
MLYTIKQDSIRLLDKTPESDYEYIGPESLVRGSFLSQSGNLIPRSSGDSPRSSSPRVVEGVKVRGSGIKITGVLGLDSEDWGASG